MLQGSMFQDLYGFLKRFQMLGLLFWISLFQWLVSGRISNTIASIHISHESLPSCIVFNYTNFDLCKKCNPWLKIHYQKMKDSHWQKTRHRPSSKQQHFWSYIWFLRNEEKTIQAKSMHFVFFISSEESVLGQ